MKYNFSEEDKKHFIETCETSKTMAEAASKLNLHFNTFKRYAIKFNCYNTNQGGKDTHKQSGIKIKTEDILNGLYPHYQTYKLKIRLLNENYFEDKCMKCGWSMKSPGNKYSNCELNHIDGNKYNHNLNNLELLCPNCHSLTPTFRARNKKI